METFGPASELDAINELLASVGEEPVSQDDVLPPSGNTAKAILRGTSRDVQEEGFWFNREVGVELTPNVDGHILIPDNALDIDSEEGDIIQRGTKLYDRESRTYVFTSPVSCEITYHLGWEELPSVARRYITALALERFVEGFPGADPTSASRQRNLMRAKAALLNAQIRNGDYNLLNNPHIQQQTRRS